MPKPPDWGPHIDVCGYFTVEEGKLTSYKPPPELADFLAAGELRGGLLSGVFLRSQWSTTMTVLQRQLPEAIPCLAGLQRRRLMHIPSSL